MGKGLAFGISDLEVAKVEVVILRLYDDDQERVTFIGTGVGTILLLYCDMPDFEN